jgi:hypothetical protein
MNRKHAALENFFPALFFPDEFFPVQIFLFGRSRGGCRGGFLSVFNGRFTEFAYLYFLPARILFVQELYAGCAANRADTPAPGEQCPNPLASMRF